MRIAVLVAIGVMLCGRPVPVAAQDTQTLADIRQELTVLYVEVQRLRRELSTTGAPSVSVPSGSVLDRVTAIETELQRLTEQTERLEHRIDRVVSDGTNRIGDLEFRLVELEGGDVSKLGETTTLGGATGATGAADQAGAASGSGTGMGGGTGGAPAQNTELAVGEQADFDAADAALEAGDYALSARLFAQFDQAYPGSPLAPEANLRRGKALQAQGDTREAARAFLASFTGDDTGPAAPQALFELGAALGRLGQQSQACVTLGEVGVRFPASDAAASASQEMAALGCT